jgi:8-oxo-dGTP pyrophosphatase MutT (NUDIX family)
MTKKKDLFFLYNSNIYFNKQVKASGILFYTIKNDEKYYLMTETNNLLSDIGGKIEQTDLNILDIAIREFCEEINASLFEKVENNIKEKTLELINYLKINIKIEKEYYIPKSKYLIFIAYLPSEIMDLHNTDSNFFGNLEIAENRIRNIFWINKNKIFEYKTQNRVHPRLWNNILWIEIFGEKLIDLDNNILKIKKGEDMDDIYENNNKKIGFLFSITK